MLAAQREDPFPNPSGEIFYPTPAACYRRLNGNKATASCTSIQEGIAFQEGAYGDECIWVLSWIEAKNSNRAVYEVKIDAGLQDSAADALFPQREPPRVQSVCTKPCATPDSSPGKVSDLQAVNLHAQRWFFLSLYGAIFNFLIE